jgi:hypothetical protein
MTAKQHAKCFLVLLLAQLKKLFVADREIKIGGAVHP